MAVDDVASSLSSEINIWYFDDATLGGPAESVFADVRKCVTELKKIGLEVNPSKCEVINMNYPVEEFTELVTILASDHRGLKRTKPADMKLLGSAILEQAAKSISNRNQTSYVPPHDQPPTTARHAHEFLSSQECVLSPSSSFPTPVVPLLPSF